MRRRHAETLDIETSAGDQAHDAGQHAGLILNQGGDNMFHFLLCPFFRRLAPGIPGALASPSPQNA
jgi:hypothetical protein